MVPSAGLNFLKKAKYLFLWLKDKKRNLDPSGSKEEP